MPITAAHYIDEGNTAKISADLLERMVASTNPDEMFSVNVWLNTISTADINTELQATCGIELQSVENEEVYNTRTLPAFEEAVSQEFSISKDVVNQPISEVLIAEKFNEFLEVAAAPHSVAETMRAKDQVFEYVSNKTIQQYVEKGKSMLDLYVLAKSDEFRKGRNESVKTLIAEQNEIFSKK